MPKRVVHLRGSDAMLGAERVVLELSARTQEFGYESIIAALQSELSPKPELIRAAAAAGIQTEILLCQGRFDPTVFKRLRELLQRQQADLLHCHGYKENFYGLLARHGLPCVTTNHLWKRNSRALHLYCWLDAKLSRHFDHVVAVSAPIQQELLAAGVPAAKISRIANGIDTAPFQQPLSAAQRATVRASLGIGPERLAVGMVSRLGVEKGHAYALEAIAALSARYPRLLLAIVGTGPLLAELQTTVLRLGLGQQVIFCGQRSDIADVVRAFDLFLLPSLAEGLPMALLEAMAAGLPTVATQVGDVTAAIEHEVSGLLTPPGDAAALAEALERLLASAQLRQQLGRAGAAVIEQHFSARQMAHQYCRLYDRLQQTPKAMTAWEQEQ